MLGVFFPDLLRKRSRSRIDLFQIEESGVD